MRNQVLLIVFIFIGLTMGQCGDSLQKSSHWEEKLFYLTEPMRVSGQASGYLPSEQVIIALNVETLASSAGQALTENNQSITKAIKDMKGQGLDDKELSTQGLNIQPSYRQEYDKSTNQSKSIFEGYKVQNNLRIITKKLELAGKIIDIAIQHGINHVESVMFVPTSSKIKELKDALISLAVEDATKRARLALQPLGYEIKKVKSVSIENSQRFDRRLSYSSIASMNDSLSGEESFDADNTQLFQSNHKYSVSVDVTFMIGVMEGSSF